MTDYRIDQDRHLAVFSFAEDTDPFFEITIVMHDYRMRTGHELKTVSFSPTAMRYIHKSANGIYDTFLGMRITT